MNQPVRFGKYYLLERINVGGMAEVFRAKSFGVEGFERLLAVKRILADVAEDKGFIDMFIDEAKIAVQLNHANIAQIFDLGRVEGSYFIAMEYVHGKDLRVIFDRCETTAETIPVSQACFIVMKICEGLDHAHNKCDAHGQSLNLVHRDVSPQNVLVSYEGEVKLIDFGIARAARTSQTNSGMLKGKVSYMSPEQVRGLPIDRRSDIFSLGVILYELLSGQRLFRGENDFSTMEMVRRAEVAAPSRYNRAITDELEQIVLQAVAREPADRYQRAIDLHDDLQAYLYASGAFYSRKDLAEWMKRVFAREMAEERRKLQSYEKLPMPSQLQMQGDASADHRDVDLPPALSPHFEGPVPDPSSEDLAEDALLSDPVEVPALPDDDESLDEDQEPETQLYTGANNQQPADVASRLARARARHRRAAPETPWTPLTGPHQRVSIDRASPDPSGPYEPVTPGSGLFRPDAPKTVRVSPSNWPRLFPYLIGFGAVLVVLASVVLYVLIVETPKPSTLHVVSLPAEVELYVDGERQNVSQTPATISKLRPGVHLLSVRRPGYASWEGPVELQPGQSTKVTLQLRRLAMASIELRTQPAGAEVWLDGHRLDGRTPMRIKRIAPGSHELEVRGSSELSAIKRTLKLASGQRLKLSLELAPSAAPTGAVGPGQPAPKGPAEAVDRPAPARTKSGADRARRPKARSARRRRSARRSGRSARARRMGMLSVRSTPRTEIIIDGKATGLKTPQKAMRLSPGPHRVTLRNRKRKIKKTFWVSIRAGRVSKLTRNFDKKKKTAR